LTPRRLATVLQELRERQELTQEELAKRSKVTRSYIAVLEAGHKKNPSVAVLKKLAKALGCPVTELLG
jgi:transcriptional regulator with XRE-family HTH domain